MQWSITSCCIKRGRADADAQHHVIVKVTSARTSQTRLRKLWWHRGPGERPAMTADQPTNTAAIHLQRHWQTNPRAQDATQPSTHLGRDPQRYPPPSRFVHPTPTNSTITTSLVDLTPDIHNLDPHLTQITGERQNSDILFQQCNCLVPLNRLRSQNPALSKGRCVSHLHSIDIGVALLRSQGLE